MRHEFAQRGGAWDRRQFLATVASSAVLTSGVLGAAEERRLTEFQPACMTLPYSQFPLQRALEGIKAAGYQFVAWGTSHREVAGQSTPVMPADAPPERGELNEFNQERYSRGQACCFGTAS